MRRTKRQRCSARQVKAAVRLLLSLRSLLAWKLGYGNGILGSTMMRLSTDTITLSAVWQRSWCTRALLGVSGW